MSDRTDLAIAGCGPAGTIAAILLARAGAKVTLVGRPPSADRIEGASMRLVAALRAQRLALGGLGPLVERHVRWGQLTGAPNREHRLSRREFDGGLLAQAADEGVRVVTTGIRRVLPGIIVTAEGACTRAGLVFEARGRRASVASSRRRGAPSVSIAGEFDGDHPQADVTAMDQGWRWRIGGTARGWAQVTVDADMARDPGFVWRRMTGAEPPADLIVRASELRLSAPRLDPSLPRLGDAAVAMDPLSGHGLFWALGSALMAVPLAEALGRGETDLAARFYADRVVGTFERQARVGRDFYCAAGLESAFWTRRSAWPDDRPAETPPPASPYLDRRVVVRGGQLAETEVLVTPQDPDGAAFVGGIEIAPVLHRLAHRALPDRKHFTERILPDVPPALAGCIHDWLSERGVTTVPERKYKEVQP